MFNFYLFFLSSLTLVLAISSKYRNPINQPLPREYYFKPEIKYDVFSFSTLLSVQQQKVFLTIFKMAELQFSISVNEVIDDPRNKGKKYYDKMWIAFDEMRIMFLLNFFPSVDLREALSSVLKEQINIADHFNLMYFDTRRMTTSRNSIICSWFPLC
jgi:hypothetical protein